MLLLANPSLAPLHDPLSLNEQEGPIPAIAEPPANIAHGGDPISDLSPDHLDPLNGGLADVPPNPSGHEIHPIKTSGSYFTFSTPTPSHHGPGHPHHFEFSTPVPGHPKPHIVHTNHPVEEVVLQPVQTPLPPIHLTHIVHDQDILGHFDDEHRIIPVTSGYGPPPEVPHLPHHISESYGPPPEVHPISESYGPPLEVHHLEHHISHGYGAPPEIEHISDHHSPPPDVIHHQPLHHLTDHNGPPPENSYHHEPVHHIADHYGPPPEVIHHHEPEHHIAPHEGDYRYKPEYHIAEDYVEALSHVGDHYGPPFKHGHLPDVFAPLVSPKAFASDGVVPKHFSSPLSINVALDKHGSPVYVSTPAPYLLTPRTAPPTTKAPTRPPPPPIVPVVKPTLQPVLIQVSTPAADVPLFTLQPETTTYPGTVPAVPELPIVPPTPAFAPEDVPQGVQEIVQHPQPGQPIYLLINNPGSPPQLVQVPFAQGPTQVPLINNLLSGGVTPTSAPRTRPTRPPTSPTTTTIATTTSTTTTTATPPQDTEEIDLRNLVAELPEETLRSLLSGVRLNPLGHSNLVKPINNGIQAVVTPMPTEAPISNDDRQPFRPFASLFPTLTTTELPLTTQVTTSVPTPSTGTASIIKIEHFANDAPSKATMSIPNKLLRNEKALKETVLDMLVETIDHPMKNEVASKIKQELQAKQALADNKTNILLGPHLVETAKRPFLAGVVENSIQETYRNQEFVGENSLDSFGLSRVKIPISELGITTEETETSTTTTPEPETEEVQEILSNAQEIQEVIQETLEEIQLEGQDVQDPFEIQKVAVDPTLSPEADYAPPEVTTFKPEFSFNLGTQAPLPEADKSLQNAILVDSIETLPDEDYEGNGVESYEEEYEEYADTSEEAVTEENPEVRATTEAARHRFTFHFDQNPVRPDPRSSFESPRVSSDEPSATELPLARAIEEVTPVPADPTTTTPPPVITTRKGKAVKEQLELFEGVSIRQIAPAKLLQSNLESIPDADPRIVLNDQRPELVLGTFQNLMMDEPASKEVNPNLDIEQANLVPEQSALGVEESTVRVDESNFEVEELSTYKPSDNFVPVTEQPQSNDIVTMQPMSFARFIPMEATTFETPVETLAPTFIPQLPQRLTKSDRLRIIQEKLREANSNGRREKQERKKLGRRVNLNPRDFPAFQIAQSRSSQSLDETGSAWMKFLQSRRNRKKFGSRINVKSL